MSDTKMSYQTIRLPKPLVKEVEEIVHAGIRGYRSKAEFIAEATRQHLDRVKNTKEVLE